MKIKRRTKIVIVCSWILFFCACFFIFTKLNSAKESKETNNKIFQSNHKFQPTTEEKTKVEQTEVIQFMKNYYKQLQAGNEQKVLSMVEDPKTMKKKNSVAKLKRYIQAYKNMNFTIESGLDDSSFIVYVTYDSKIKDIKTLAPGIARYYVKKEKNSFVLYNNEKHYSEEMKSLAKETSKKDKIQEIIHTTNEAYNHALEKDKELRDFFKSGES